MKKQRRGALCWCCTLFIFMLLLGVGVPVWADQIKDASVFADAQWNYVTEWTVAGETDWLQSMCETDKYIVCLQDSQVKGQADTLTVFDRWSYELLFEVRDRDYEHGNGMTYNPNTNEIYIAPYFSKNRKNRGCVFALDADTLKFKRRILVSDGSWNVSGIEYMEDTDQYIIQTTASQNFTFLLFDSNFSQIDTLVVGDQSMGNQFQDFCVSGDFIISVPWMRYNMADARLQVYSISQKAYLGSYPVYAPGAGDVYEIESVCQSDAGEIVLAIGLIGTKRMTLYNTIVPIIYTVTTSVENGTITPTRGDVDIGTNYKVKYRCTEDYELKQLQVDGQDVDVKKHKKSYTFNNIQDDHTIWAKFTEIPKFDILTSVTNGEIDEQQLIRRDEDVTIHYEPDLHYEMDKLLIDGVETDPEGHETEYTFEYIQGPHSVEVQFKEIPSFVVSTKAYNGIITATNKKVYRDEDYTVKYQPEEGYQMAYLKVDGEWLMKIAQGTVANSYTFKNIQKGHDVEVIYQWKYFPYVILAGAFGVCIPMGMIYMAVTRLRKRRKYRLK